MSDLNLQPDKNKIKRIVFIFHFIFWLVIFSLTFNFAIEETDIIEAIIFSLYTVIISSIPFYLNYAFFSKYLFKKQNFFIYFLLLAITILIPLAIVNFSEYGEWLAEEGTYSQSLDLILNMTFLLLISNLIKGTEVWLYNRHRQQQIEKEKLQAELNFLRIQINPHFLFNTLNNIYSLAYTKDNKAAPMIAKLSQIMRYMLNDCKENRVQLEKEIAILKNYIDLHLLKIGQDRNIDLYTEGINTNHRITPLLLLTLLENSFKHGDIDLNEKGWIKVECIIEEDILYFYIGNSTGKKKKTAESSGIGLNNIQKQLELNYPDNFEMNIEELETEYSVKLKINLD